MVKQTVYIRAVPGSKLSWNITNSFLAVSAGKCHPVMMSEKFQMKFGPMNTAPFTDERNSFCF